MKISANINLAKIDEKNVFITKSGVPILNVRILIEGDDIRIVQRFLDENRMHEDGSYVQTPLLGRGVYVKNKVLSIFDKIKRGRSD